MIASTGLELDPQNPVREYVMDRITLQKLYGHVDAPIYKKLTVQMLGKLCLIGAVKGKNAVQRLVEISGSETDPAKCLPNTIRHRFGNHRLGYVHENAIHRPKTDEEALDQFKLFGIMDE